MVHFIHGYMLNAADLDATLLKKAMFPPGTPSRSLILSKNPFSGQGPFNYFVALRGIYRVANSPSLIYSLSSTAENPRSLEFSGVRR
ncbi:MAG: hypothetical protein UW95_C0021G0010 [Parcubacteria group bacterium GW2011_GWC1_45_14]|nr:MAG: hypothetical protein UW95_C0021G0010 [Parcubacteria group bacterium GW2011_GWC1_45_14]